jgi:hypothetical protein
MADDRAASDAAFKKEMELKLASHSKKSNRSLNNAKDSG